MSALPLVTRFISIWKWDSLEEVFSSNFKKLFSRSFQFKRDSNKNLYVCLVNFSNGFYHYQISLDWTIVVSNYPSNAKTKEEFLCDLKEWMRSCGFKSIDESSNENLLETKDSQDFTLENFDKWQALREVLERTNKKASERDIEEKKQNELEKAKKKDRLKEQFNSLGSVHWWISIYQISWGDMYGGGKWPAVYWVSWPSCWTQNIKDAEIFSQKLLEAITFCKELND